MEFVRVPHIYTNTHTHTQGHSKSTVFGAFNIMHNGNFSKRDRGSSVSQVDLIMECSLMQRPVGLIVHHGTLLGVGPGEVTPVLHTQGPVTEVPS